MNGNERLIARNIELEMELRFVKEQLSQANSANLYLLKRIGNDTRTGPDFYDESKNLRKDNDRLRKTLRLLAQTSGCKSKLTIDDSAVLKALLCVALEDTKASPCDRQFENGVLTPTSSATSGNLPQGDLLTFDDQLVDAPVTNTLAPDPPHQGSSYVQHRPDFQSRNGLGPASSRVDSVPVLNKTIQPSFARAPYHHYKSGPYNELPNNENSPINPEFCSDARTYDQFSRGQIPYTKPARFFDREHNRLMGAACFIEAMSPEEQEQHWVQCAAQLPRHSANEWQDYYMKVIRPDYLRKRQQDESEDYAHAEPISTGPGHVEEVSVTLDKVKLDIEYQESKSCDLNAHGSSNSNDTDHEALVDVPTESNSDPTIRDCTELAIDTDSISSESEAADVPELPSNKTLQAEAVQLGAQAESMSQNDCAVGPPSIPSTEASNLFYSPTPPYEHCRSVLLLNVASDCSLNSLLHNFGVARESLLSAKLIQTAGMKTEPPTLFNTALLLFLTHQAAVKFVKSSNDAISHTMELCKYKNNEQFLRAVMIGTPSRPIPYVLLQLLPSAKPGEPTRLSNVLYFKDPIDQEYETFTPELVTQGLLSDEVGLKHPLDVYYDEHDTMKIECADILDAKRAYDELYWHFVRGTERKIGFVPASGVTRNGNDQPREVFDDDIIDLDDFPD